ncbi:MAG: ORF6N domain-containing protein [Ferruginibacter sp.]
MELSIIQKMIHIIRGQRVMLDFDLASLYKIDTKYLNQVVLSLSLFDIPCSKFETSPQPLS